MSARQPATVVVLAAGAGTRMRSATPKVLHAMCGRTMLGHVLAAVAGLPPAACYVVVGAGHEQVEAALPPGVHPVHQPEQRGTGHAVREVLAHPTWGGRPGSTVVVCPGDAPLVTTATLQALLATQAETGAAVCLLTARLADPTGYGRVVRDRDGGVRAVIEHADADEHVRGIEEVNTGVYAFSAGALAAALEALRPAGVAPANAQAEEYLTDVVAWLREAGEPVSAHEAPDPLEVLGVNDRVQLAAARCAMRDRLLRAAMLAGVTVTDPRTVWLGVDVRLEPDVTLHQNVQLHGATVVATGAVVGPDVTLSDTTVGAGARVDHAVCTGAEIGAGAVVGPYTHLRPGTVLGNGAKAGEFVGMKAALLGEQAKVPHLSYVGDAEIGARSNVGAGTIFANYDGRAKHRTSVGSDVRIGSDNVLVAPVRIGDGAYTAAGSVLDSDVPPGALGIARARQHNVEGWVARRRPATGHAHGAHDAEGAGA